MNGSYAHHALASCYFQIGRRKAEWGAIHESPWWLIRASNPQGLYPALASVRVADSLRGRV